MWRPQIKPRSFLWGLLLLALTGCGFADLKPIGFTTVPGEAYTVLPETYSPVIVTFDTVMEAAVTESVFQIMYPSGLVEGDLSWEGNKLCFVPAAPWAAGVRYALKLSGTVYSLDGRELLLSREIPFYALSPSPMPYVKSVSPADGASVGVFALGETVLEFSFSLPMDRRSVEAALNCGGMDEGPVQWLDDDRILRVPAGKALSPWTVYHWSISEKALSRDGAPLTKAVSGRFITDKDNGFPRVLRVIPLLRGDGTGPWASWTPAGISMEKGLGPEQGLGVEFSKPMDGGSLRYAFSFEPSIPGRVEQLSPLTAVFIPDRNPDAETAYILKISGDIKDSGGLKMGEDFVLSFVSDIPFLKILSLVPDGMKEEDGKDPENGRIFQAAIAEAGGGVLRFAIRFSLPFTPEAQGSEAFRIFLESFFPVTPKSPRLRFIRWLSADTIRMEWEDLKKGTSEEPQYYRLRLPGGRNGITNGGGSYMEKETYFYFEAAE
jgi:hypothetical protein